jgi:hypothetical protein
MKKVKIKYTYSEYVALTNLLAGLHSIDIKGIKSFQSLCLITTLQRIYVKILPKTIMYNAKINYTWETPEGYALLAFWKTFPEAFETLPPYDLNVIRSTVATLDQAFA